jgi:hypothetical protein
MAAARLLVLTAVGLAIAGCGSDSLPKPLYALQPVPPPYRKAPGGAIIDNQDISLDAEGYRVDSNGNRIREVDVGAKLAGQTSNPVAGLYISSIGANASGTVMLPSEGAGAGVGAGPGSASPMPSGDPMVPIPPPIR